MAANIGIIGHEEQGKTLAQMIQQIQEDELLLQAYKSTELTPEEIKNLKISCNIWENKAREIAKDWDVYRQAEEQGLLIKLPCKVGDTVYWISPFRSGINQGKVEIISLSKFGFDLGIMEQGGVLKRCEFEKVFLTREAAEEALKGSGVE